MLPDTIRFHQIPPMPPDTTNARYHQALDQLPHPKPDQGWQGLIPSMRNDSIDAVKDGWGSFVGNLFKNGAKKHTNPKPDQGWKGSLPA